MAGNNKNCINCKFLEFHHSESEYSSSLGYHVCDKREESEALTQALQLDSYLTKSKVCHEAREKEGV